MVVGGRREEVMVVVVLVVVVGGDGCDEGDGDVMVRGVVDDGLLLMNVGCRWKE